MKSFSFSDMNRLSGEILETALTEPVALTKYGRERLVIVPVDRYRAMVGHAETGAYTIEGAPESVDAELRAGLEAILAAEAPDA